MADPKSGDAKSRSPDHLVAQPVSPTGASSYAGPAGEVMRLLDEIAAMRQENAAFAKLADDIANKMQQRLNAHKERVLALRLAYYHDLGRCLRDHRWPKRQREDFIDVMMAFTNILSAEHDIDLLEDFLRYSGLSREDLSDGHLEPTDNPSQGSDEIPDPRDFDNEDDFAEAMGAFFFGAEKPQPKSQHRKTDKQSTSDSRAKSSRRDEPLKRKSQDTGLFGDIRALYLMLARALHPDKESDAQRRAEKTAWMQRVTTAYASKNLGDLLDILMRNPLDALGPYLAEAPLKTLKGFAKRLKRELAELRQAKSRYAEQFHPMVLGMIRKGVFSEQAYKRWESDLNQTLKVHKERAAYYQHLEGVKVLLKLSREHDLRTLL